MTFVPHDGGTGSMKFRFEKHHRINPHMLLKIFEIVDGLVRRGWTRCGISLIFERLRWLHAMETKNDKYKLNNNYRAFYARLVMHLAPSLGDFFDLRGQVIEYEVDEAALKLDENFWPFVKGRQGAQCNHTVRLVCKYLKSLSI